MQTRIATALARIASGAAALGTLALVPLVPLVLPTAAQAAPTTPFVATQGGVFDGPGNPVIPEVLLSSGSGPLLLNVGSLPDASGSFRADFGSNGFDIQTTGGIDREVDGGSVWTDGFTVTGGAGGGFLSFSSRIQGSVAGDAEMGYALFVSTQPFDLQTIIDTVSVSNGFWSVQLPASTRVLFTGVANRCGLPGASRDCGHVPFDNFQGPLDLTLTTNVPFTGGQTVYVASLFAGGVGVYGGHESFLNSADFGISAPAGTSLTALSGSAYAAAVPEPPPVLLFGAGIAFAALRVRHAAGRVVRACT